MIGSIIYFLGLVAAIMCVLDILKKDIDPLRKIIIAVIVLATSWIGIILYYYVIRHRI